MSGRSIRLIDIDELLATLEQDINVSVTGEENMEAVRRCLQEILDDVKGSPVVDAVEVIRCKDCKFHHDRTQCKKRIGAWFDDDYCNGAVRAERMDGDRDEPAKRL